jgi:hypothetical protein
VSPTIPELIELKKAGVGTTDWTNVFRTGRHRDGPREVTWTRAHLARLVANFKANPHFMPPVVIGHGEGRDWMADTGLPAAGVVADLRVNPDRPDILQARLADIPRIYCEALEHRVYFTCSVEIDKAPSGCAGEWPFLRRLALMGGDLPAVKTIGHLAPVYYADRLAGLTAGRRRGFRFVRAVRHSGRLFLFSEAAAMADDTGAATDTGGGGGENELELAVIKAKWPDIPDDFLGSLSDDQLNELALAAAPAAAEEPAAEPPAMADPPADRDQLISEIVAAGNGQYTAEQLAQMPDDQLKALWQQLKGGGDGGTTNMSERNNPAPAARPGREPAGRVPAAVNFAERDRRLREYDARMAALERQQRLAMEAAHQGLVHTFCEQLRDAGYLTPALVGTRDKPGPTRKRLLSRSSVAVAKFGESPGKSDLEEEVDILKRELTDPRTGKPMFAHLFGEKLPGTPDADGSAPAAGLSAERRKQLLETTVLGRVVLRDEAAAARRA